MDDEVSGRRDECRFTGDDESMCRSAGSKLGGSGREAHDTVAIAMRLLGWERALRVRRELQTSTSVSIVQS